MSNPEILGKSHIDPFSSAYSIKFCYMLHYSVKFHLIISALFKYDHTREPKVSAIFCVRDHKIEMLKK